MNIYLIEFDKVSYDETRATCVSANNEEEAKKVADITKEEKAWSNTYESNIEKITLIGTYYKDVAEEIICDFWEG